MVKQRTIHKQVSVSGKGLHSGKNVKVVFNPAPDNTGIVFRRTDKGNYPIKADIQFTSTLSYATNLTSNDGISIATTEHLLATLVGMGIDNIYIDINAEEVPIMDGSASAFVYLLSEAGLSKGKAERKYIRVKKPVHFGKGDRRISVYPSNEYKISYTIEFDHHVIGTQARTIIIKDNQTFLNEISPARTFGFVRDIEMLRKNGLALGGSLDNAIVIDNDKILNPSLRFEDEFVRHKILDVIGDMALLGYPIRGHIIAHKAGHEIHAGLAKKLRANDDCYDLVTAKVFEEEIKAESINLPVTAN